VDLYWLPLGAGGHSVRWNGRLFEAIVSRREHRPAQDLFHAALEVRHGHDLFVIEMTPAWPQRQVDRGVVQEGPVGARWLGNSALFRYEVRRWRSGAIPDDAEAVDSPRRLSNNRHQAERVLELVQEVPAFTWGRDELRVGDMWNSNSLVAWLLERSGHHATQIRPPARGRAPGWKAGLALAVRQEKVEGP